MYKIFLMCFLVNCALVLSSDPIFREDYKYYEDVNGWVKLHKIPANWHDARLRCRAEGASLASPSNSNMRNMMVSLMIAESTFPGFVIYSGIHSTFANGSYSTIDGIPITALPVGWARDQPDHVYTENCIVFHMNTSLEDVSCDHAYQYICYKKFEVLTINKKCNTVDNEYNWDGRTRHCYKFHRHGQTWSRAHMVCTAEGGHLAIINSGTEVIVIKELFEKYPREKIFSIHLDAAIIGFREWPDEGSWYTVHGQTLEEAGYEEWQPEEPNNLILNNENQNCGGIWRSGLLDDIWCSHQLAFICEKDPGSS